MSSRVPPPPLPSGKLAVGGGGRIVCGSRGGGVGLGVGGQGVYGLLKLVQFTQDDVNSIGGSIAWSKPRREREKCYPHQARKAYLGSAMRDR